MFKFHKEFLPLLVIINRRNLFYETISLYDYKIHIIFFFSHFILILAREILDPDRYYLIKKKDLHKFYLRCIKYRRLLM